MVSALQVQNAFPYGRSTETVARQSLLDRAQGGSGGALIFAGGPGEGRTTLLYGDEPATVFPGGWASSAGDGLYVLPRSQGAGVGSGWTVLRADGHADESGLAYAGLQRLIEPLAARIGDLPPRQRESLADVISGRPPAAGPLTLGVNVLALLRRAARHRPVLCLIDDAHLLDPPSWQLIRLVARRLSGMPVALLATVTADERGLAAAADLPVRRLAPLDETASLALLHRCAPDLAPEVASALVDVAAGHPGALTEIEAALTPEQRRGYAAAPVALPPDSALRAYGRALLAILPPSTCHLLLLAAAEPAASPVDLLEAAAESAAVPVDLLEAVAESAAVPVDLLEALAESAAAPADPREAAAAPMDGITGPRTDAVPAYRPGLNDLEPAERAGMVEVTDAGVRFTPPVLRGVVYGEAPIGRRHAAHRALAVVLAARGRRLAALVHRARISRGPDEGLARELLEAADNAPALDAFRARRYAAELCGDPAVALAAARSALAAGRPRDAAPLLRRAGNATGQAVVRARARALIAETHARGAPAESRETLLDVAAELMTPDPAAALDALLVAGEACGRTGKTGRFPGLARLAAARCRDGRAVTVMNVRQVLGLADLMTGEEEGGFAHLREVLRLAEGLTEPEAGALIRAAGTGILLGDDDRAARLAGRAVTFAREGGNAPLVPEALEVAAYAELAAGRHDAAHAYALDGVAVARGSGRPDLADAHRALLGLLAAFRGDAATAHEQAAATPLEDWAEALLDLVRGEPGRAAERLTRVARTGSLILRVAVAPHLVETTGAGSDVFDRWAGRTGRPAWLALRGRCRALTCGEGADDWFREALGWHERDADGGYARAHTQLLYGRHLRRRRRPAEARDHLRRAAETFHRFDAQPWAEQAARELRAAGERIAPADPPAATLAASHRHALGPAAQLTAQQLRIAGLVAEGATNREVAAQLHLSPRTIDHHLRNVFARLGVRSRTELAHLLAAG
ncbi:MAG: LuxR family transcriptional regulator [Actinomycetota bacterium]|nr:LuxR family transcriptional regulator [Actinomycetota bacterium]